MTSTGRYGCSILVRHSSVVKFALEEKITVSVLIIYSRNQLIPYGLLCNLSVIFKAKLPSNAILTLESNPVGQRNCSWSEYLCFSHRLILILVNHLALGDQIHAIYQPGYTAGGLSHNNVILHFLHLLFNEIWLCLSFQKSANNCNIQMKRL